MRPWADNPAGMTARARARNNRVERVADMTFNL
jgi:hypothetical protein